jgi:hypothetical protein
MIPLQMRMVVGVLPGDFAVAGGPQDSTLSPQPLSQISHIMAARFASITYGGATSRFDPFGDDQFWTDTLRLESYRCSRTWSAIMIRFGNWDPQGINAVTWSNS